MGFTTQVGLFSGPRACFTLWSVCFTLFGPCALHCLVRVLYIVWSVCFTLCGPCALHCLVRVLYIVWSVCFTLSISAYHHVQTYVPLLLGLSRVVI
jgi:hypothetical protein